MQLQNDPNKMNCIFTGGTCDGNATDILCVSSSFHHDNEVPHCQTLESGRSVLYDGCVGTSYQTSDCSGAASGSVDTGESCGRMEDGRSLQCFDVAEVPKIPGANAYGAFLGSETCSGKAYVYASHAGALCMMDFVLVNEDMTEATSYPSDSGCTGTPRPGASPWGLGDLAGNPTTWEAGRCYGGSQGDSSLSLITWGSDDIPTSLGSSASALVASAAALLAALSFF